MEQAHLGPLGKDAQVYPWEEHENPWELIATGLRARGLATPHGWLSKQRAKSQGL